MEIAKELNEAFLDFKKDQDNKTEKQQEVIKKQSGQIEELDEMLHAMVEKMTKLPGGNLVSNSEVKRKDFEQFLRTADKSLLTKSMSIATEVSGGYTHIPEVGKEIISAVADMNPLLREVNIITIHANKYEQIFTTTRMANARAAEGATRSETSTANFEKTTIELFDLYAYPTITNELLHSSAFMLDTWIRNDITESFNEALSYEFITGDGVVSSVGLLNNVSANDIGGTPALAWGDVHSETTASLAYDDLLGLISALPVRYKAAGNCKWYMSTEAIEAVRALKDSNGLPIWRQDFGIAGAPMVLLGYQVIETPQVDGTGFAAMFGDMRQAYAFVSHDKGLGFLIDQITQPGFTKFYASLQCAGGVMDSRAVVALEVTA